MYTNNNNNNDNDDSNDNDNNDDNDNNSNNDNNNNDYGSVPMFRQFVVNVALVDVPTWRNHAKCCQTGDGANIWTSTVSPPSINLTRQNIKVWGRHRDMQIDRIHTTFCETTLGPLVKQNILYFGIPHL